MEMKGDLTALGMLFLLDGLEEAELGLEAMRPYRNFRTVETKTWEKMERTGMVIHVSKSLF